MSALDDFFGTATDVIGNTSLIDMWKTYNAEKIALQLSKSTNTINELNASTEAMRLQNEALLMKAKLAADDGILGGLDVKKYVPYALAAGALYVVYRLLK